MQVMLQQWERESRDASLTAHEQTLTTKREFEALFDDPVVAQHILDILAAPEWGPQQYVARIASDRARTHGISTWSDHAVVRIDPTHDASETVYIADEYSQRGRLPTPDAGETRPVNAALPKEALTLYTAEIPSVPECWNCGTTLKRGADDRIITVDKQHFTAAEAMPDSYPYPARAELLCDDCTLHLVTSDDVEQFGTCCAVCEQHQATAVKRVIVPEGIKPSNAPTAPVCATCIDRESRPALLRKVTQYQTNPDMVGAQRRRSKRPSPIQQ